MENKYCSVCDRTLSQKDLEGICLSCYKTAKNPVRVLSIPPHTGFVIGLARGLIDLGSAWLGRTFKIPDEPDHKYLTEQDLKGLKKLRERLSNASRMQGEDCFNSWCDRLGIPR